MATSGCTLNIKIGEAARPSTYKVPVRPPDPKSHGESWRGKYPHEKPFTSKQLAVADASGTAAASISHPANKMQLPKLQSTHDANDDGVYSKSEFANLLAASGQKGNSDILFEALDTDGSGTLSKAEIEALGQDATGRARRA